MPETIAEKGSRLREAAGDKDKGGGACMVGGKIIGGPAYIGYHRFCDGLSPAWFRRVAALERVAEAAKNATCATYGYNELTCHGCSFRKVCDALAALEEIDNG